MRIFWTERAFEREVEKAIFKNNEELHRERKMYELERKLNEISRAMGCTPTCAPIGSKGE